MLRVFIYEFLTAGGCWALGAEPPSGSLLAEGRAMRDALARDFAAVPSVGSVHILHDVRLSQPKIDKLEFCAVHSRDEELELFQVLTSIADATIVIAPEFSSLLLQRVQLAEQVQAKLISPDSELVRQAADKSATADFLSANGIHVPRGLQVRREIPQRVEVGFPAVLKPNDGAGSGNLQRINHRDELLEVDLSLSTSWRLEQFVPGIAASVSILAGPRGIVSLQPCFQNLSNDGRFTYLGGSTPLPPQLEERAKRLAIQVASVLPNPRGYLGIDMVLGSAENGAQDTVIEINPRLTTSYLGLRQACEQNLAEAMLKCVRGDPVVLSFRDQTIEFAPSAIPATC